jgi:hypothetical protein
MSQQTSNAIHPTPQTRVYQEIAFIPYSAKNVGFVELVIEGIMEQPASSSEATAGGFVVTEGTPDIPEDLGGKIE